MVQSAKQKQWKSVLAPWQQIDWLLLLTVAGLTGIGSLMIRSTELNQGLSNYWWQHALLGAVGVGLVLSVSRLRYERLVDATWIVYGVTNLSLLLVMIIGVTASGSQRWIPVAGFNIQPSEFAKLGLIISLAGLLHKNTAAQLGTTLKVLGIVALPWSLVFLQPDLGTSLVFGAIALGMLYWGDANPGWLILLISPGISAILFNVYLPAWLMWVALAGTLALWTLPWRWWGFFGALSINLVAGRLGQLFWDLLQDYQKDRLILFLDPSQDPLGGGYHLIQSRIAIGAGQLWGQGLYQGTQTQLNFIPEQHTDFIFSAVGEELGFAGAIIVLLGFWLVCLRLIIIAQNAKDNFGSLIAAGTLAMIIFQVLVNVGMTMGLAPITGIPLPWMSYGRSAMLTNFLALGLAESVMNYRHRLRF
ncbi:MAG: rod shape-determining protein RodA [Cyanobacteria bacterium P01_A01_bin.135]